MYWIHLPEHTDILSEGYIGITTKTVETRFKQHERYANNGGCYPISKAIIKYKSKLIITTLVQGSVDYCYFVEGALRPSTRLGWNIIQGGLKVPHFTRKHTEESKRKISEASIRNSHTPAKVAASRAKIGVKRPKYVVDKMKLSMAGRLSWETSMADRSIWCHADEIYEVHKENYWLGYIELEKLLSLPKYSLKVMLKKFRNNWNPIEDSEWVTWILSL